MPILRQLQNRARAWPLGMDLADCGGGVVLPALLLTFARHGEYRGEPGIYRCGNCGRAFTFFV